MYKDSLELAEEAYVAILRHPHDTWRLKNQALYCTLRDFIADHTGMDSEEVQDEYESRAIEQRVKEGANV